MTETHYYETLKQEDVEWGVGATTKRNPGGGQLTATQVGIHSMSIGQAAVETTWNPASIPALGTESLVITVPGAALGDFVERSFSLSLSGLLLFTDVTAANTVTVTLFNPTTTFVDLPSGTVRVLVLKSR